MSELNAIIYKIIYHLLTVDDETHTLKEREGVQGQTRGWGRRQGGKKDSDSYETHDTLLGRIHKLHIHAGKLHLQKHAIENVQTYYRGWEGNSVTERHWRVVKGHLTASYDQLSCAIDTLIAFQCHRIGNETNGGHCEEKDGVGWSC